MLAVARIRVDVMGRPRPLGGVGRRVPRSGAAGQYSLTVTGSTAVLSSTTTLPLTVNVAGPVGVP